MIKIGDTYTGEVYGPFRWDWDTHHYRQDIIERWTGTVVDIVHYADNSIVATVLREDGSRVNRMIEPPRGDICF